MKTLLQTISRLVNLVHGNFIGAIMVFAGLASAQTTQHIFTIERSTNSNKIYYEARITADGAIDQRRPVHGYWVLLARDSTGKTREELNLFEKNMAFGLKTRRDAKKNVFTMTLAAYPKRAIMLFMEKGKAVAQTVINGRISYLEKIYISSSEAKPLPKVNYIELFGTDGATGEGKYEKITPR